MSSVASTASPSELAIHQFINRLPRERGAGRQLIRQPDASVSGDWYGCALSSVFQPLVTAQGLDPVGYEAFLRTVNHGRFDLSPWSLFSDNAEDARLLALDRLARTMHALNFVRQQPAPDALLFLNVHGRLLTAVEQDHGAAFARVCAALDVDPARIVIETPLTASAEGDLLSFVVRNYHRQGFRTAVNVESLEQWRSLAHATPADYVKIEARKYFAAASIPTEDDWAEIGRGAQLALTRIEAPLPADFLAWANLLLQGYHYGRPQAELADEAAHTLGRLELSA